MLSVLTIWTVISASAAETEGLTAAEENLICRFADAACGEEAPLAAKLGCINVVLNRVADSGFPNSIAGVIFEEGAFDCVKQGRMNDAFTVSAAVSARDALGLALLGKDPTGGALYFADKRQGPLPQMISFEAGNFVFGF